MPDVGQKVISGNAYNQGGAVVHVTQNGTYKVLDPVLVYSGVFVQSTGILDTRFDNPTYYTA